MASYDGIILDQDGISIGDAFPIGVNVTAGDGAATVVLTAEVFCYAEDAAGLDGPIDITLDGGTATDCYPDIADTFGFATFKNVVAATGGYNIFCADPIENTLCFTLTAYILGDLASTDTLTITHSGSYPPDTASIRLIVRKFTGLVWDAGDIGPFDADQQLSILQPFDTSGAVGQPPTDSTGATGYFALYNGFSGAGWADDFAGDSCIPFDPGPSAFGTDSIIWAIRPGLNALTGLFETSPHSTVVLPDFNDPPGGAHQVAISEANEYGVLRVGDSLPCTGEVIPVGPFGISAKIRGGAVGDPADAITFTPGMYGFTRQRRRSGTA